MHPVAARRYDEAFRLQRLLFLHLRSVPPAHSGRGPLVKAGDHVGIGKLQHDVEQLTRLDTMGLVPPAVAQKIVIPFADVRCPGESVGTVLLQVPLFQRAIRLLEPRVAAETRKVSSVLRVPGMRKNVQHVYTRSNG